jgi:hypothetical protein
MEDNNNSESLSDFKSISSGDEMDIEIQNNVELIQNIVYNKNIYNFNFVYNFF